MPILGVPQDFVATGLKITIPAFFGLSTWVILPFAFEGAVMVWIPGPVIWTRTPCTTWWWLMTVRCIVVERPAYSCFGVTITAVQYVIGLPSLVTRTFAVAWLFVVFDSGRAPLTSAVFVSWPESAGSGVVTSVIVTEAPFCIVPRSQLSVVVTEL